MVRAIAGLSLLAAASLLAAGRDVEIEKIDAIYRVNTDNTSDVRFHQQVRALTAQGRAQVSRIQLPYMAGSQEVEILSIRTLKKDGTVVNGDVSSSFDANSTNDPLGEYFSDLRLKVFIPPNVETGDTVDYEVVIHTRRWLKPGEFWFWHRLTTAVAVDSETVELDLPADRKISLYENPAWVGKVEVADGRRIERWTATSTGKEQPGVDASMPLFAVTSLLSWDAFGTWISSLNHSAIEPALEVTALAARLTAGKSTDDERIAALYTYVATKVRYVAVELGIGRLKPHGAAEVLRNSYGDCKDQTTLLRALLAASGFKTEAVLTTPGTGVGLRNIPTPDNFTHEFTAVETKGGLVFLDPSMGPVPPQQLPPGVRGRTALIIGENSGSVIEIPAASPVKPRFELSVKGAVSGTGGFEGIVRAEVVGLGEMGLRRLFQDANAEDTEKALAEFLGSDFKGGSVRQITHADPANLTTPFWVQFEASYPAFFPASKTSMRIDLGASSMLLQALAEVKKPAKPIPVEATSLKITMDLALPTFALDNGLPVHRKTDVAVYDSEFTYNNGHQYLNRTLIFTGKTIGPEEWDQLAELVSAAREEVSHGFLIERQQPVKGLSAPTTALQNGRAAFQRSDLANAKANFLEAVQLDPLSKTAWNELGQTYARLREFDKAEAAYRRQIEINPKDLYSYNNLGLVYRALQRDDEAIAMYRKQIEVSPNYANARNNLAGILASKQQWKEALAEEKLAVNLHPDNPDLWAQIGQYQLRTGDLEDGGKSFDRALALVHTAGLENNIAYFLSSAGYQLDRARQLISGTLEPAARRVCEPEKLSNDDVCAAQLIPISNWLDTAAWVIYRQGKAKEAEAYERSAWAIAPRVAVMVHLSAVLAATGNVDESVKCFAEASSQPGFNLTDDVDEARNALRKALGGPAQLEARLKEIKARPEGAKARVIALVDGSGKIEQAQAFGAQTPESAVEAARKLTLGAISWPDHSIRSIRTIELQEADGKWVLSRSSVGQPAK